MKTLKEPRKVEDRKVVSSLETVEVETGERTTLATFDYLIEAPNRTRDGKRLIINSSGHLYSFDIAKREWSPDSKQLAFVSYRLKE